MIADEWLKKLAPGTLLHDKRPFPNEGFLLVYHAEVEVFPGPWTQLHIWTVQSRGCKLRKLWTECEVFQNRWAIVDVDN